MDDINMITPSITRDAHLSFRIGDMGMTMRKRAWKVHAHGPQLNSGYMGDARG